MLRFDLVASCDGKRVGGHNIQAVVGAPDRAGSEDVVALHLASGWWVMLRNQFAAAPGVAVEILESVAAPLSEITAEFGAARGAQTEELTAALFATESSAMDLRTGARRIAPYSGGVTADRFLKSLFVIAAATLVAASTAHAAAYSGLKHACKYTYGVGDYQSVSYDGHTGCAEASALIDNFTDEGARAPRVGTRTGRTPHGTWRCVTIRRKEAHGVIYSSHRITCSLTDDPRGRPARVRFFYES